MLQETIKRESKKIITISNNSISIKVLPEVGGRIVSVQKRHGENILKSDPSLWNYEFSMPIERMIQDKIIPFNGHIVWVGPQSEWWKHQNIIKEKRNKSSNWPPDPYLIYGKSEILELQKNYIKTISPKSKYTGVQLIKEVEIRKNGIVILKVEAKNIRKEKIAWDLWFNTRMDGFSKVYVPIENKRDVRLQYNEQAKIEKMPYTIEDGFFFFNTKSPSKGINKIEGKAFIYPNVGKMFAFVNSAMFIINFARYKRKLVHPEHGLVEIYNCVSKNGDALIELEYHTQHKIIGPNEKIYGYETWEIIDYKNSNTKKEHINFIKQYLRNN